MLVDLDVRDFAIVDHLACRLSPGFNVLTGETGAGKSILIDSLGAILGQLMSSELIRTGCDWLRVEAVFTLAGQPAVHAFLAEQAIADEEDMLIVTRQITRSGKNMILVNGCHVTLAILRSLGNLLVDVHGQNENLALLRPENQFSLLDGADSDIQESLQAYTQQYEKWVALKKELAAKEDAARDYAQRIDMLRWQDKEIREAKLQENEDEELEQEIRKLTNAEKIAGYVESSHELLDGGGKMPLGVLAALAKIKQNLVSMSRFDTALDEACKMVEDASCQLQEAAYELRDYGESLAFEPQRLDQLQSRMDVIYRLRKKYGATIADVLQHHQAVQDELAAIENYDEDILALKKAIAAAREQAGAAAARLTGMRTAAAKKLSTAIEEHLLALGMPNAHFSLDITPLTELAANGADQLTMLFSANVGETLRPVQKVASGGELSRIALAVKTVAASREDAVASMVFDEIDTGIGGRTAQMVAERIAQAAAYKQVLCITHLPQIACMADVHLYISKQVRGEQTVTEVRRLTAGEQVNEIARMASGVDVTAASLDNAREMLDNAKLKKAKQRQVR